MNAELVWLPRLVVCNWMFSLVVLSCCSWARCLVLCPGCSAGFCRESDPAQPFGSATGVEPPHLAVWPLLLCLSWSDWTLPEQQQHGVSEWPHLLWTQKAGGQSVREHTRCCDLRQRDSHHFTNPLFISKPLDPGFVIQWDQGASWPLAPPTLSHRVPLPGEKLGMRTQHED